MSIATFRSSPQETKRRLLELKKYFAKNLFKEGKPCYECRFYEESCRPSHPGPFFYGKLHHVGDHYDLTRERRPLRIAVVAQDDNGEWEFKTFRQRSEDVRASSARPFSLGASDASSELKSRNPHMRGTTSLLRLIFEAGLGADRQGEFLEINKESVHIFNAFALLNASLCTAARPSDERGSAKPTNTMLLNCSNHLKVALDLLEPTIIVAEGGLAAKSLLNAGFGTEAKSKIEEISNHFGVTMLLKFSHPSSRGEFNWGNNEKTRYLLRTIKPTVSKALKRLYGN